MSALSIVFVISAFLVLYAIVYSIFYAVIYKIIKLDKKYPEKYFFWPMILLVLSICLLAYPYFFGLIVTIFIL